MAFVDYYKLLELEPDASVEEVKKAYKRLALKLHPDTNPTDTNAAETFRLLNEGYEVLSDEAKRKQYDAYGQFWKVAETMDKAKREREEELLAASGRRGFFRKLWKDQLGG